MCFLIEIPAPFIIAAMEPSSLPDSSSSTSFLILKVIILLKVSQVVITHFKAICSDLDSNHAVLSQKQVRNSD